MRTLRKEKIGQVISNKMDKTAVVLETKRVKHIYYGKYIYKIKKYLIHDEKNICVSGDWVRFMETRPLSKKKSWILVEKLV